MFKLDDNFLRELGLGTLPPAEKNKMLAHIYETLEMKVGMRLAEKMSNEQLDEFEGFINSNDEAGALKWLETNFPNYKQVVAEELEKLKAEIKNVAPQIVAQATSGIVPGGSVGLQQNPVQPGAQPPAGQVGANVPGPTVSQTNVQPQFQPAPAPTQHQSVGGMPPADPVASHMPPAPNPGAHGAPGAPQPHVAPTPPAHFGGSPPPSAGQHPMTPPAHTQPPASDPSVAAPSFQPPAAGPPVHQPPHAAQSNDHHGSFDLSGSAPHQSPHSPPPAPGSTVAPSDGGVPPASAPHDNVAGPTPPPQPPAEPYQPPS